MKISILLSFLSIVHFCLPKNEPKRAADHLVPRCGTPPRCSQKKRATSKSRCTPPSRLSVFCSAAWLCETAKTKKTYTEILSKVSDFKRCRLIKGWVIIIQIQILSNLLLRQAGAAWQPCGQDPLHGQPVPHLPHPCRPGEFLQ